MIVRILSLTDVFLQEYNLLARAPSRVYSYLLVNVSSKLVITSLREKYWEQLAFLKS